ncbi:hypothetical protein M378DRAFT_1018127 [Amanita muscaria Koide BX008]|uniref:Uncharacterized protein n=1 Tax=Amanita muscaria (strain Koide BX008) TaxID=946122 RepID=A0A0C2WD05_AMAMK|nr:hypothetical protein M378DRAFT_1018127 [Amanita muscaria Koide BX008]
MSSLIGRHHTWANQNCKSCPLFRLSVWVMSRFQILIGLRTGSSSDKMTASSISSGGPATAAAHAATSDISSMREQRADDTARTTSLTFTTKPQPKYCSRVACPTTLALHLRFIFSLLSWTQSGPSS